MQAQTTRTRGNRITRWTREVIVGGTLLAILAVVALSISDATPFGDATGLEQASTQLEIRHDLSNHRYMEMAHVEAISIVQPATHLENEFVLAGHRYKLYPNDGIVTSDKSTVNTADRLPHRYDLLDQPTSTNNYPTNHRVGHRD